MGREHACPPLSANAQDAGSICASGQGISAAESAHTA